MNTHSEKDEGLINTHSEKEVIIINWTLKMNTLMLNIEEIDGLLIKLHNKLDKLRSLDKSRQKDELLSLQHKFQSAYRSFHSKYLMILDIQEHFANVCALLTKKVKEIESYES